MAFESLFGSYAGQMQAIVDSSLDIYEGLWFPKYFRMGITQASLTFEDAVGRNRIEAAASVVDRDAATPLRNRPKLETYFGNIPAIKEAFLMKESEMREFLLMQNSTVLAGSRKQAIMDNIYGDVTKVTRACLKRVDIMCLEAVSKGIVNVTVENNPDGVVLGTPLDLLMPATNKVNAAFTWATANTATPLTDIEGIIESFSQVGKKFSKMLISRSLWTKFKNTDQVKNTMLTYYFGPKAANSGASAVTTFAKINEYMEANDLPTFELVEEVIGIEKDAIITNIKPFSQENLVFIPAGELGEIKNAFAMEQIRPVPKVSYATYNKVLVSKWSDNEPLQEWTKGELNAMPAMGQSIDSIVLLKAIL